MSLWRWTPLLNFKKEFVAASLGATALTMIAPGILPPAHAEDSSAISAGPVSDQEAKILWRDGKSDFDHGMDEDAIPKLERFIARYPGYPSYFEARHVLAQAYLRQNEPTQAKAELKIFIQARGKTPEAIHARVELARTDLELKLFEESLLTADEAIRLASQRHHTLDYAEALLLRARALMGLQRDSDASATIASARKIRPSSATALLGEMQVVELDLKLRQCLRFPSNSKLEESQVRDQLARRGSCLMEGLLNYKQLLATENTAANEHGTLGISKAYASYWEKCQHPPGPLPIHPTDRDAQQLKTYFRELSVVLEEDCRQKIRQGLDLLRSWKSSASVKTAESLNRAASDLEKLK